MPRPPQRHNQSGSLSLSRSPATLRLRRGLYLPLRRGPGKQYRIIGSIKAGEPVTQLALSDDGKYAKVRDSKQREAWIVASELQENPSFRSQHEQVQQQVTVLNDKLANIDSVQARELKQRAHSSSRTSRR